MAPAVIAVRPWLTQGLDIEGLSAALRETVRGEVRFDKGSRGAYDTDASNYRQIPIGVVIPKSTDDVVAAVEACHRFGAPVFSRGGGTSLGGQCTNTAVLLDMAKYYNKVESIDGETRVSVVQPGMVLDELNRASRGQAGIMFGPRPATHTHCTIGGMLGNNSCGSTAQWSGTTAENVRRLEVLTYDGLRMWVGPTDDEEYEAIQRAGGRRAEIYRSLRELVDRYGDEIRSRFPNIPRRISGYNLPDLLPENGFNVARALVGSESTCVTILRAELDMLPEPPHLCLLLAGYQDVAAVGDRVTLAGDFNPYMVEGLDHRLLEYERGRRLNMRALHKLPEVGAWMMVKTIGDTPEQAHERAEGLLRKLQEAGGLITWRIYQDPEDQEEIDKVRDVALGATSRVPGRLDTWPGWEDSAVPPERLGDYLRDLRNLLDDYGYDEAPLYGHFGQGCVHTSIPFDLVTANGIGKFRTFLTKSAHLVADYGGSLSGEHGDGQARGELLPVMFGERLVRAFERFKAIFDPDGKMNPGKVVHANPLDAQLRLGVDWRPPTPQTHFDFPDDGGFVGVPTRCFGVGECRRHDSGTEVMCPSYVVTKEEEHSTRGRMRLLYEMMRGDFITDGWRSTEVRDSLDLCLACKGCKRDCPIGVDVATYKSEFLSHHYAGRIRPLYHYSLGWLPLWARLAAPVPFLANTVTRTPGLRYVAKAVAGIDQRRAVPKFASRRFVDSFHRRGNRGSGERGRVVLWPDTFTNSMQPHIAASATVVLEAAGFEVIVPRSTVCCGLTWISTGQLSVAEKVARHSLDVLIPYLREGLQVVGLEPSCTSVMRSDMVDLLDGDVDAVRLRAQTVTLAELLNERAGDFTPRLSTQDGRRPVGVVQKHCHQHAVLGFEQDKDLMERIGLEPQILKSGCCGLAGDFGMTAAHREVSMACAERVLLPAVRDADPDAVILADGFSCRTQIDGAGTGRAGVHLAELVAAAVRGQRLGQYPERTIGGR
ncbi:FAD-binding and (Fe-S)-binding domain-containing protein [Rugosimonospora acidiphila]|uniref:FAD-binding and (Fe-S)-binding domain-containing protein n=1 Tax=Rugosimonospora acidiphila TaxID=556531 RepID=A0ABP9RQ03_9ACTN